VNVRRGNHFVLPLALLWLLSACARSTDGPELAGPSGAPVPATSIALSVSAGSVFLVNPDTGVRQLVAERLSDFQAGHASWAPDHRQLAFANSAINLVDAETGKSRTVVRGQSLSMPAWSPDGTRIAYGDGTSLWVTPADTRHPIPVDLPKTLAALGMAWQPGPFIAFQGLELECSISGRCTSTDLSEIWRIGPDGTGLLELTHVGHAESPKWSNDGSSILFVRRLGGSATAPRSTEVWQVEADGSGLVQVVPIFDAVAAEWSPDGARLAIVRRGDREETLELWVGNADGTDLHRVGTPVMGTHATLDW
jgi:Tol biopolymer transport system component